MDGLFGVPPSVVAQGARRAYTSPMGAADTVLDSLLEEGARPASGPWSHSLPSSTPPRADKPWMPGVLKLNYTHEALIDLIIQHPELDQNQLAASFGYSASWLSLILGSDAFRAKLVERQDEILSPEIRLSIEERFKALVRRSQDILLEKLHSGCDPDLALGVLATASKSLGYGARPTAQVNISFVAEVPAKAASSEEWARQSAGGRTIEGVVVKTPVGP